MFRRFITDCLERVYSVPTFDYTDSIGGQVRRWEQWRGDLVKLLFIAW